MHQHIAYKPMTGLPQQTVGLGAPFVPLSRCVAEVFATTLAPIDSLHLHGLCGAGVSALQLVL
jgi:hypothetical protein